MTNTVVRIEGIQQALRQFRRAPDVAKKHIAEAVRVTEITTAQAVRNLAPVSSGALKQSITSQTTGLRATISIEEGGVMGMRPDVYWRFVEFGTFRTPAQPFIRLAAEAESEPFVERIRKAGARMERDLTI